MTEEEELPGEFKCETGDGSILSVNRQYATVHLVSRGRGNNSITTIYTPEAAKQIARKILQEANK